MKIVFGCLILGTAMFAVAENEIFDRELPDSASKLIDVLRSSGAGYTVRAIRLDYVKESDLPHLMELLNSKEPCGFVALSISSIYYPGRSTVGHEAAYLIEDFWKRYYPTELTSQQYKPDIEGIKRWYRMWSPLKKLAEQAPDRSQAILSKTNAASSTSSRTADFHLVQTQIRDALAPGVSLESLTVYVLVLPDQGPQIFRLFDSKPMEEAVGYLPPGSVLQYDGNALMARPPEAQIQALMACCKKKGINFILGPTN